MLHLVTTPLLQYYAADSKELDPHGGEEGGLQVEKREREREREGGGGHMEGLMVERGASR
jgi:hypothetical protein